jgi:23S rRNA pseudouridine2604 synthase
MDDLSPTPLLTIRLNKRLADLGFCSRREADEWIEKGWVLVNGKKAILGSKVLPTDIIKTIPQAQHQQSALVTILLNKPIGYVSSQAEAGYTPAVTLITPSNQWSAVDHPHTHHVTQKQPGVMFKPQHLRGLATAGRLDFESSGLLVFTQDGRIAKQLIGENSEIEKEYLVRVRYRGHEQDIEKRFPKDLLNKLNFGLQLDGKPLKPAQVMWQNPEQLRFILKEGKKRQIRRMCEAVGLEVSALKRVRIGRIKLGALPLGQWRYLGKGEFF